MVVNNSQRNFVVDEYLLMNTGQTGSEQFEREFPGESIPNKAAI